VRDTII